MNCFFLVLGLALKGLCVLLSLINILVDNWRCDQYRWINQVVTKLPCKNWGSFTSTLTPTGDLQRSSSVAKPISYMQRRPIWLLLFSQTNWKTFLSHIPGGPVSSQWRQRSLWCTALADNPSVVIECSSCKELYHDICEVVPDDVWSTRKHWDWSKCSTPR